MRLTLVLILCTRLPSSQAARILGYAFTQCVSHQLAVLRVGQELGRRGHEFHMLLGEQELIRGSVLEKHSFPGLHVVSHASAPSAIRAQLADTESSRDPRKAVRLLMDSAKVSADEIFADKATLQRLKAKNYEALLRDTAAWPGMLLQQYLELPTAELLTLPPMMPYSEWALQIPNPVAYLPQRPFNKVPKTMWDRYQNMRARRDTGRLLAGAITTDQNAAAQALGLWPLDPAHERGAVAMVASSFAFEYPFPVPPRVEMVGPVLAEPEGKPLPPELASFLDQGMPEHRAIYVSMGTLGALLEPELRTLASALAGLPNPVLLKLGKQDLLAGLSVAQLQLGPNIRVTEWCPQNDVLAHASTGLFITQGGINSLYQAMMHAVVCLVIPLFGEQAVNAAKVGYHGFGLTYPPQQLAGDAAAFRGTVQRLLSDSSFQANATKMQQRLWSPVAPASRAADLVERVIRTRGEPFLQTREHGLRWYQLHLLDVFAVLALAGLCASAALLAAAWGIVALVRAGMRRQQRQLKAKQM